MTRFSVNDRPVEYRMDPGTPLLWALRDASNLTGTKYGCGTGDCGACTVVVGELDAAGAREAVRGCYDRFLALNPDLLAVCTDWQMRGDAVNDHADAEYDQGVIDRLVDLHVRLRPILADLRSHLARFAGYSQRLRGALERVTEGERDWFTKPTIDSYHTVWFELHEDLLATLGLERSKEAQP
jgi:hypothetical protein